MECNLLVDREQYQPRMLVTLRYLETQQIVRSSFFGHVVLALAQSCNGDIAIGEVLLVPHTIAPDSRDALEGDV